MSRILRWSLPIAAVLCLQIVGEAVGHASAQESTSLFTPKTKQPAPAVVLLIDESAGGLSAPIVTRLKDAYLEAGFAVLLVPLRAEKAQFTRLTAEALAAVAALEDRPEIEPTRIGLWSMGEIAAWIAPQVALEDPELAFLILLSAPMESPGVFNLRSAGRKLLERHGLDEHVVDRITRFESARWDYLETGMGYAKLVAELGDLKDKPWYAVSGLPPSIRPPESLEQLPPDLQIFLRQRHLDPLATLSLVAAPVLVIYGDLDQRMPVAEFAVRLHFLADSLDLDLTVRSYPEVGHDLMSTQPEPDSAASTDRRPLDDMVRWTLDRVDPARLADSR